MATDELAVRVRLIDAALARTEALKTEKAISRIGGASKKAGRDAQEGGKGFGVFHRATSGLKFAAATAGITSLVFGIKDAVQAGVRMQESQAQLQQSLKATGAGVSHLEEINRAVEQSATHGGFGAPEQIQGITKFVAVTGDATRAVDLNRAATGLARGAHLDYASAQQALAQATVGNVRRLQRYVGIIQPVTSAQNALTAAQKKGHPELVAQAKLLDKQATAAMVTQRVMQRFGGAQQAYSRTAAGAMSNAQHAFDNLKEELGKLLLPLITKIFKVLAGVAPVIAKAFHVVGAALKPVFEWLKKNKDIASALIGVAAGLLVGFLAFRAVTGVIAAVNAALAAMSANPVVLIIAAVAALVVGFIVLYKRSKAFREGMQAVFRWLGNAARNVAHAVVEAFKWISTAFGQVTGFIQAHWRLMLIILTGGIAAPVLFVIKHFQSIRDAVKSVVDWIAHAFTWLADKITWPFRMLIKAGKAAVGWAKGAVKDVGNFVGGLSPFADGGVVHLASGGPAFRPRGTDTVPAMLTPGEFVLRRQIVSAVGVQNLQTLNAGGQLPGGQAMQVEPGVTKLFLNGREIAEAVTQYAAKKQARR